MTIKHIHTLFTVLVLGLGLISCSKETEIQYKEDTFKPQDILVEKADRSFTALNDLSTMDFSRQLVINDDVVSEEKRIKNLVLSTSCRAQSATTTSSYTSYWPNPTTIPILDILPTDVLLQRKIEPIYCDISYTITNGYSSTSSGKTNQIKIFNADSFSNLDANQLLANRHIYWEIAKNTPIVPFSGAQGTIDCDDFSITQDGLSTDTTLAQFLNLEIILSYKPKSAIQNCRAIFRTETAVALSPVFQLELPPQLPIITYSFSKRADNDSIMNSTQKVQYQIWNPNSFPIRFRLDARDKTLLFRGIYSRSLHTGVSPLRELPLDWFWMNALINTADLSAEFTVPGETSSLLEGQVRGSAYCKKAGIYDADDFTNGLKISSLPLVKSTFMGFNMDLNSNILIYLQVPGSAEIPLPITYSGKMYNSTSTQKHWDLTLRAVEETYSTVDTLVEKIMWDMGNSNYCLIL